MTTDWRWGRGAIDRRECWPCDVGGPASFLVECERFCLFLVKVLSRVRGLKFEDLDKAVESSCEDRAESWAKPVDPVIARELSVGHAGAE